MRIQLSCKDLEALFFALKRKDKSLQEIAHMCDVCVRTLTTWRKGTTTIPASSFGRLAAFASMRRKDLSPKFLPDFWHIKGAAKKGGYARMKLYGNFGTPEGRKRGALMSMVTHRKTQNSFFIPRAVHLPVHSLDLAEFVGILLGDGGITKFQVTITLHRYDDKAYMGYVVKLCKSLFQIDPAISVYPAENVARIIISRVALVAFLKKLGLHTGNKVKNQADVPAWIRSSGRYTRQCMRGLMDTDGSFYVDRHTYKNKEYYNCAMNFTNRSLPLLAFVKSGLEALALHPTQKTPFSLFLRKEEEISRYFSEVGSSNPKHYGKFKKYFKLKYGNVPKRL